MKTNSIKKKLPSAIATYLDQNLLFNKFGIVNVSIVQGMAKDFTAEELKDLINERFGAEFKGSGGIEFLEKD